MNSGRLRPHIAMMVMALAFSGGIEEFEDERRRRLEGEPPAWGKDAEELAAALPITAPVAEIILRAKGRDMAAARALVERAMAEGVDPLHLLEVERGQGERMTIGSVAVDHASGPDETAVIKVDVHSGTIRSLNLDVQIDGCERIRRSAAEGARRFNELADAAYRTSGALDRMLEESDERVRRREAKREREAVARKAKKRRRGW